MTPFKVNVSKEALENFYGRELMGREIETAQMKVAEAIGVPKNWVTIGLGPYWFVKEGGPYWSHMPGDHIGDNLPERPLSDFLPEPKASSSELCCAECIYTNDSACPFFWQNDEFSDSIKNHSGIAKQFYCADFESLHTGLGVRGTIIAGERVKVDELRSIVQPTPNCAKCQWFKELDGNDPEPFCCSAIGMKAAESCHNTPECRALYVEKSVRGGR